jgi:hypothetical protein
MLCHLFTPIIRQRFPHVVRIRTSEAPGNLFERAAFSQIRPYLLPQPGIEEFPQSRGD